MGSWPPNHRAGRSCGSTVKWLVASTAYWSSSFFDYEVAARHELMSIFPSDPSEMSM
jgi:hypothetical protein